MPDSLLRSVLSLKPYARAEKQERNKPMRHLGIFLMGSLALAACASNSPPPATTSSSTVAQATDEPNRGPDFAPASNDGLATASTETRRTTTTTQPAPNLAPASDTAATAHNSNATAHDTANRDTTAAERAAADTTSGNAAATPTDRSSAPGTDADNSRVNQRDRNSAALTPMDQGSSASDRNITQQIRKALMNDKSLSFTAKNVKIITIDGKVTLRGPVKSEAERSAIEAAARRAAGDGSRVDSQLEISK